MEIFELYVCVNDHKIDFSNYSPNRFPIRIVQVKLWQRMHSLIQQMWQRWNTTCVSMVYRVQRGQAHAYIPKSMYPSCLHTTLLSGVSQ